MKANNSYQYRSIFLETYVRSLLSQCLQGKETVETEKTFAFDFFLKNGLKKLRLPSKTYVEIRYKLSYSSYAEIIRRYDKFECEHLLVIFLDDSQSFQHIFKKDCRKKRDIRCVTIDDLEKKCKAEVSFYLDSISSKIIIERAKSALKTERITLFLGAGVSQSAGIVGWEKLLKMLKNKRKKSLIPNSRSSAIKGRYIIDTYYKQDGDKLIFDYESLTKDLKKILYKKINESKLISAIANIVNKVNCESIITYNYDDLIEQKLDSKCQSISEKTRCPENGVIPVYHVHGFVSQKDTRSPIILGEREYHCVYNDPFNWGNIEQLHALNRNTCFFIGLSMTDPNLRRLIDLSNEDGGGKLVHYVFLYNEKKEKHEKIIREMGSLGLNCIVFDEKDKLPNILNSLTE